MALMAARQRTCRGVGVVPLPDSCNAAKVPVRLIGHASNIDERLSCLISKDFSSQKAKGPLNSVNRRQFYRSTAALGRGG
jgi:hypothetical protein